MRYCAFLRGVNVGGINIKMDALRAVFADLGFNNVKTVLASGNVLFDAELPHKAAIERALSTAFGYEAWIVLLDTARVRAIIDGYPFDPEPATRHAYVLLSSDPEALAELVAEHRDLDSAVERILPGDGVVYWEVERGATLNGKFGKVIGRKRYKPVITSRNLRTMRKVAA